MKIKVIILHLLQRKLVREFKTFPKIDPSISARYLDVKRRPMEEEELLNNIWEPTKQQKPKKKLCCSNLSIGFQFTMCSLICRKPTEDLVQISISKKQLEE